MVDRLTERPDIFWIDLETRSANLFRYCLKNGRCLYKSNFWVKQVIGFLRIVEHPKSLYETRFYCVSSSSYKKTKINTTNSWCFNETFSVGCLSDNKIVDAKHGTYNSFCNQNAFSKTISLYIHAQGAYTCSISLCFSNQGQYKKRYILTHKRTNTSSLSSQCT